MSRCSFPTFSFAIPFPVKIPTLPAIPSLTFSLAFSLPCPLD